MFQRHTHRYLLATGLLAGCAHERAPAPEDLDGLCHYLYAHYDEPRALSEGMENLGIWLDTAGRGEAAQDGMLLSPFTAEEVAAVARPDRDPQVLIGVALPWLSPHGVAEHGAVVSEYDQTWNNPGAYLYYNREVVGGDVGAFNRGGGRIDTASEIDMKGAFGVHIPYLLDKAYTWAELDQGTAFLARASVPEVGCAPSSDNCLYQSFALDFFYSPDGGDTLRLTAAWNELVSEADPFLTEEQRIGLMVSGLRDVFEGTDAYLAGER
ncbi:MAG: hypothetical protein JXX28_11010 [Deltaproteobacteria bacterium]|nr:hypothetical protein [Deltaproteobacteria bacterium]